MSSIKITTGVYTSFVINGSRVRFHVQNLTGEKEGGTGMMRGRQTDKILGHFFQLWGGHFVGTCPKNRSGILYPGGPGHGFVRPLVHKGFGSHFFLRFFVTWAKYRMANTFNYDGTGTTGALSGHTSDGSTSLYNFTLTVLYGNFLGASQNGGSPTPASSIAPVTLPSMSRYLQPSALLYTGTGPVDSPLKMLYASDYRNSSGVLKGSIFTFETRRLPIGGQYSVVWTVPPVRIPYGVDMVTVPGMSGTDVGGTISIMAFSTKPSYHEVSDFNKADFDKAHKV